jgi:hypothetical protein
MFKKAGDNAHYLARTGSHSTKESPTGLIRMIPPTAKEPLDYYNSVLEEYETLRRQLEDHNTRLRRLRQSPPADPSVRRALVEAYQRLERQCGRYRTMVEAIHIERRNALAIERVKKAACG